jgi:hypothetical protein
MELALKKVRLGKCLRRTKQHFGDTGLEKGLQEALGNRSGT